MQRIDTAPDERYLKAAIYGKSGTGKTSLGVTAPRPLILASERQAIVSIRQAAKRLKLPEPATLYMEDVEDYKAVIRAFRGDRSKPFQVKNASDVVVFESEEWPETVVLDSLTDAARMISDRVYQDSPAPMGKDGLPAPTMRHWGVLGDRFQTMVIYFRDLPANVLFLCLEDDRTEGEGEGASRTTTMALPMRKMAGVVAAACNLVGYSYRTETRDKAGKVRVVHGVLFDGPERFVLKRSAPLRDREAPDFGLWGRAVFGALDEAELAPQPAPSIESLASQVVVVPKADEAEATAAEEVANA